MGKSLKPWTPFELGVLPPVNDDQVADVARALGRPIEEVRAVYNNVKNDVVVINSRYQVNIRRILPQDGWPAIVHLSIKRRDKNRVGPERYRDFLRIKNELVGEDHEAVEIYPAMSRNVDTANQYHLWVIAEAGVYLPFGFREGLMISEGGGGARQHPFEE